MMLGSFDFSAAETDAVQQSVVNPQTNASRAKRNRKRVVRVLADKASATLADGMVHPLRIFGVVCLLQYQPTAP
jgi:hypothetical protein